VLTTNAEALRREQGQEVRARSWSQTVEGFQGLEKAGVYGLSHWSWPVQRRSCGHHFNVFCASTRRIRWIILGACRRCCFHAWFRAFGVAMEGDELHFHEMRKSSDHFRVVLFRDLGTHTYQFVRATIVDKWQLRRRAMRVQQAPIGRTSHFFQASWHTNWTAQPWSGGMLMLMAGIGSNCQRYHTQRSLS
jgi:hypothetical protein